MDPRRGQEAPRQDGWRELRALTTTGLFDRLDVLHILLGENADRWSVSDGGAVSARILHERREMHREWMAVEHELRAREAMVGWERPDADPARFAAAHERAAAWWEEAVVLHEVTATALDQRHLPQAAQAERLLAEVDADRAQRERMTADRMCRGDPPGQ